MSCKRLILVILMNFIMCNRAGVIHDRHTKVDLEDTMKIEDSITDEASKSGEIVFDKLKVNTTIPANCTGNCTEKTPAKSNRTEMEGCPYERKDLCLIFSLSKIAKVQVADTGDPTDRGLKSKILKNTEMHEYFQDNDEPKWNGNSSLEVEEDYEAGDLKKSSWKQIKQPNVPCRAIRDVYIPEAKQRLPAFACKFENRMFLLSSPRFFQDRRPYLGIRIDEGTLNTIKSTPKHSRSNKFNVIPALLVLKVGDTDYRVQTYGDVSNERKVNRDKGNR